MDIYRPRTKVPEDMARESDYSLASPLNLLTVYLASLARTRLHLDMADAINVLMHANPRADGSPGCAVWDIFRPEDADGLREFLLEKYAGLYRIVDPIHSQQFYLDSDGRRELFEKKGIVSYRIYQYPGQAIMVPAGCAHQVCNLADCIKIACDFVSPRECWRKRASDDTNPN